MNDTVTGIILKQTDYREADVIISVLTKEYGKLLQENEIEECRCHHAVHDRRDPV